MNMDNEEFKAWLNDFSAVRLPLWNEFPDFELYMDQLVNLGNRYLEKLLESEITPSMINSYVKKGLMQRPAKKKYAPANVAELVVISLLKSIYPLETIKSGLQQALKTDSVAESYNYFAELFNHTISLVDEDKAMLNFSYEDNLMKLTEQFAIHSLIYKLIGQKLVEIQLTSKK
ncbi:DUF1836 domain-containing protein [Liquorilactobacillus satsumensis]|uniref:BS ykrK family protein n=1 Tax=Liquorilactobacillus satsumensis DSM 16230 = JCM 12392 TaxID=1423801 RepID=A0A0R1UZ86_9LACO|nr:DUF1836 domain-containing protein [Liquorilactobacillus satsumensis]KRL98100.1 hypothetical protein FD50_GL000922 [Liquorilactobacillus satsumensis DSM 16230 = JCM 12392]